MAFTHSRTGAQLEASLDAADAAVEHDDAAALTVTVGGGGDYASIGAALTALRGKLRGYTNGGRPTIINLLTGFTMNEQVICGYGADFSWVRITSVDAEVPIARSAITEDSNDYLNEGFDGPAPYRAAFMGGGFAKLPALDCKMAMDTSGVANDQSGIFLTNGASMQVMDGAGIDDTTANGAHVMFGAKLIATGSAWDGNGITTTGDAKGALRADWAGHISAAEAAITNQLVTGVLILGASQATLRDATITTCAEDGIETGGCSIVHARGLDISGCSRYGMFATEGSIVRILGNTFSSNNIHLRVASGAIVNGTSTPTFATSTSDGIQVDEGGQLVLFTPSITGAGAEGIAVDFGGRAILTTPTITGSTNNDMYVNTGGQIMTSGTVTTTAGNTLANNLTDSNVGVFGQPTYQGSMISGRGGNVRGRGTATITSGNTSVTITHGVDDEYSLLSREISVVPTNAVAAATSWYVNNVTTTQFDIVVTADPGASATFAWHAEKVVL